MKSFLTFVFVIGLGLMFLFANVVFTPNSDDGKEDTINAVIGDASYLTAFGTKPDASVSDAERITTHLSYVEEKLRSNTPAGLTPEQLERRSAYLDHLASYRQAGAFPVNDDHPGKRLPTFISDNGNICAVGYLVLQTVGEEVVQNVNEAYKYSFIQEIEDPVFLSWAEESGFTTTELAMIQPMYHYNNLNENKTNQNELETGYSIASAGILTANSLYWTQDLSRVNFTRNQNSADWAGLAIGAGTMLFGTLNLDNTSTSHTVENNGSWTLTTVNRETNHLRTGVSAGHIVVGAATFMRSAFNLLSSSDPEPDDSGFTVTGFELPDGEGTRYVGGVAYRFRF